MKQGRLFIWAAAAFWQLGVNGVGHAQPQPSPKPVFDLSVLPSTHGVVSRYVPGPHGDLHGLLLEDGTQVVLPPDISSSVASLVKPGQAVTVLGLKATSLPLVRAYVVINARGLRADTVGMPRLRSGGSALGPLMSVQDVVASLLFGWDGEVQGVVLRDGSVVYIAGADKPAIAGLLKVGQTVFVSGYGADASVGKAIDAVRVGLTANQTIDVQGAPIPQGGAAAGSPYYDQIAPAAH